MSRQALVAIVVVLGAWGEITLAILWTDAVGGRIGRWRFRRRDREIAQGMVRNGVPTQRS